MRRWLPLIGVIVVAAAAGAVVLSSSDTGASRRPEVGQPAPAFDLESVDGGRVSLESLRGRPVIVNFFASWCLPCKKELPLFLLARGRNPEIALVGVIYDDVPAAARVFRDAYGRDWPALIDSDGHVAAAYAVPGPPQTFFVDRDGILRAAHLGEIDPASLDAKLATIL